MSEESERLLEASFRGVPFFVQKAELSAGRRTQVHEYPLRDKPFVEDLGRASRTIVITAFLVGDDYIAQSKRLIGAVETEGSGQLVHPWLGEMKVTPTAVSKLSFDDRMRVASVTLTFTESGDLLFPSTKADKTAASHEASDAVSVSAIDKFAEAIHLEDVSDYVEAAMSGDLLDVLGVVSSSDLAAVFDMSDRIADLVSDGMTLLSQDPSVFARQFLNACGLSRLSTSIAAWSGVVGQIKNLTGNEKLSSSTKTLNEIVAGSSVVSSTRETVVRNRAALETLVRQVLIAQAVGVSTIVGTSVDRIAPEEIVPSGTSSSSATGTVVITSDAGEDEGFSTTSYEEIVAARDVILEMLDAEIELTSSDDEFRVLMDARVAVFEEMTERADREQHLLDVELPEVRPAVVVAYDYYDDATRDEEIVARNHVEHGGFCPVNLKVVSA